MSVHDLWEPMFIDDLLIFVLKGRILKKGTSWDRESAQLKIEYRRDFDDWYLTMGAESGWATFGFLNVNTDSVEDAKKAALVRVRMSGFVAESY